MSETTEKLIRDIAEKLGTTTDHLWGVLCRQAPITAITDMIELLVLALLCVYVGRRLKRWHKSLEEAYEEDHPGLIMLYVVFVTLLCITIGCALCCVSGIVTAFTNPEYWALRQIIK